MKWFIIDYEISIFGKDTETVKATDKETAKSIALLEIAKRHGVKEHEIEIFSCKVIQS
tara:strand:+ start:1704 stop:1877 length:174 start_codon:yes stop_codon:yes gene_type:complete